MSITKINSLQNALSNINPTKIQKYNNSEYHHSSIKTGEKKLSKSSINDTVDLSAVYKDIEKNITESSDKSPMDNGKESESNVVNRPKGIDGKPVTESDLRVINDLKKRDSEVRKHEQAHIASSGGHARGGTSYTYHKGPDGKRYAVGGEVNIDTSEASSPEKTANKMRAVKRAALAPANPSAQDRRVASKAQIKLTEAEKLIALEYRKDTSELKEENDNKNVDESSNENSNIKNVDTSEKVKGYNATTLTFPKGSLINVSA